MLCEYSREAFPAKHVKEANRPAVGEEAPVNPLGRHAAQDRQPAAHIVAIWVKLLCFLAVHEHVVKGVRICMWPQKERSEPD
jgi:hypothetical protein